ncbi:MAG: serine hydrolase domain-containing protein [Acidobacteriota bacterium]
MNRVKYALVAIAAVPLTMALVPTAPKPEEVGLSSERLQRIHDAVQRHIDAKDVSGAVTLVARKGRIAHLEAHGLMDIESNKPMPKDGIFRLASMSKPITGAAVMMLVEEGKIRLNDPVSRFIPEFKNLNKVAVPKPGLQAGGGGRGAAAGGGRGGVPQEFDAVSASREITIKDLLTHGSGLMSGGLGNSAAPQRAPTDTLATFIPKLASVPLDFQPGTLWRYSGQAGFDTLSRVVEIASGQTYEQFLKQRLFDPLGMKDTGFYPSADGASRLVTLYARQAGALVRNPNQETGVSRVYFSGAGGIMTTAVDYLQFAQMMLNGGQLNGKRFLSPKTIELMTSNHTGDMVNGQFGRPARGMGFGLSMQMVLDPIAADLRVGAGTFGWAGAYGCNVNMDPKENMVSIIMMQTPTGPLQRDFENATWQAIVE